MDKYEKRYFIKYGIIYFLIVIAVLLFAYYLKLDIPTLTPFFNDYYVKEISINFNKPYLEENIKFKVNEKKFSMLFKVYYGEKKDIIEYYCDSGLEPYVNGIEVGCKKDSKIDPGEYSLKIKYKPEKLDWNYVKWVAFNNLPRRVEKVETNGELPYSSSYFKQPIVAFYPKMEILDFLYLQLINILSTILGVLPIIFPFIFLGGVYYIYSKFGKEPKIVRIPEYYHGIPNSKRHFLDVLFLFKEKIPLYENPKGKILEVMPQAIEASLVNAVVEGIIKIEDGKIKIINKEKFEMLTSLEKEYIKTAILITEEKKVSKSKIKNLVSITKKYIDNITKNVYDTSALDFLWKIFIASIVFSVFFYAGIPLIEIAWNFIFNGLINARVFVSSIFIVNVEFIIGMMMILVTLPSTHFFTRFKNNEVYKEKLLWESFNNLLKKRSLIEKHGLNEKDKWGKWLVYAFIFGINKNIKKFLIEQVGLNLSIKDIEKVKRKANLWVSKYGYGLYRYRKTKLSRGGFLRGGFSGGGSFGAR